MFGNEITLSAEGFKGTVQIPPSKSIAHRAVICAALSGGQALNIGDSKDIRATLGVLESLGFHSQRTETGVSFEKWDKPSQTVYADCNESGSTLRFAVPLAAALGVETVFTGQGRLPQRPIGEYGEILADSGVEIALTEGHLPLKTTGQMGKGHYRCRGDITSQYISGLMMALPLVGGGEIEIIGKLESQPYVDLTVDVMSRFGVTVRKEGNTYYVSQGPYQPNTLTVEGDYSQAAFWLVAGAVSGEITLTGLRKDSLQGDRKIIELLRRFGAEIQWQGDTVKAVKSTLKGICIDVADIPDLVPVLAVAASQAEGETRIVNGARLRLKESDRLTSTCEMIRALGGKIEETEDGLVIKGSALTGGSVDSYNDHRIAMSAAVASAVCGNRVVISECRCVDKSYPAFYEDYERLGGTIHGIHMG